MKRDREYRRIEWSMYNYESNREKAIRLRSKLNSLMSVRGHSYEAHTANGTSDPVSEVVSKRLDIESKIRKLEGYITPVKELEEGLKSEGNRTEQMREILKRRYQHQEKNEEIQKDLKLTASTYWRRVKELMREARKYFDIGEKKEVVEKGQN